MKKIYVDLPEDELPISGLLSQVEYQAINWRVVADLIRERNFDGIPPEIRDILVGKLTTPKRGKGRPEGTKTPSKRQKRNTAIYRIYKMLIDGGVKPGKAQEYILGGMDYYKNGVTVGAKSIETIIRDEKAREMALQE
jgi:hypothetical protein